MTTMAKTRGIEFAAVTDLGKSRSENQDRWFGDAELGLFLIADGMGGHAAGGLAAQLAVNVLPRLVRRLVSMGVDAQDDETRSAIANQVTILSNLVYEETRGQPGVSGTGTTIVLVLLMPLAPRSSTLATAAPTYSTADNCGN